MIKLKRALVYFKYLWIKAQKMKKFEDLKIRIDELIALAEQVIFKGINDSVYVEIHNLKSQAISFTESVYGREHSMSIGMRDAFRPFSNGLGRQNATYCLGCLKAIKSEIDGGWLGTLKGNIMAESFSDFMEMGNYFLEEGYKDAAAVMFGGVLEEHLRQLCILNNITTIKENGKFRRAEDLNIDLVKNGVYNGIIQKAVTTNLGIRNSAAHAKYDEYTLEQVRLMNQSISLFMQQNGL